MPVTAGQLKMDRAYEGQIASNQSHSFYRGTLEEFVNKQGDFIPFGSFVVEDGGPGHIKLPSDVTQTLIGVVPIQERFERINGNSGVPADQTVGVMYQGVVWMMAETAMTRGSDVYVRYADSVTPGPFTRVGRIRNNDNNSVLVENVKVLEDVVAGELVKLELNLSPLL